MTTRRTFERARSAFPTALSLGLQLAALTLACAGVASGGDVELPEEMITRCLAALPDEMARGVEPGTLSGEGSEGSWQLCVGEMDGAEPGEAVLLVLPTGHRGEIHFFAQREDGRPVRKKISLKGGVLKPADVKYEEFAPGKALLHLDGREAGQVLYHWTGRKLAKIWEIKRHREQVFHWFEIDDLDDDGVSEVITYVRREMDVFRDDEFLDDTAGGHDRTLSSDQVDALDVYRLENGRWRKSRELLESLRG